MDKFDWHSYWLESEHRTIEFLNQWLLVWLKSKRKNNHV